MGFIDNDGWSTILNLSNWLRGHLIREYFRNGRVVEGKNGVFQKKGVGKGQNVVDEVRGAEKRLVEKIDKLLPLAGQFQHPAA